MDQVETDIIASIAASPNTDIDPSPEIYLLNFIVSLVFKGGVII